MERQVLVVEKKVLFSLLGGCFQGFKRVGEEIIYQIEESAVWMEKEATEHNPKFKQIIGYCSIINNFKKSVFAYCRSKKDKEYPERRLQGMYSIAAGGHIEPCDGKRLNGIILKSVERELSEEVDFRGSSILAPFFIGGINDDSDDVGKVHFGLYFIKTTSADEVLPKDKEIVSGGLKSIKETKALLLKAESWSKICFPILQESMKSMR